MASGFAGPGDEISGRLIADAVVAMYQAQRKGGGRHHLIDLREPSERYQRHSLEGDLGSAFAQDHLTAAYQPIVRSDDVVIGVEAPLR